MEMRGGRPPLGLNQGHPNGRLHLGLDSLSLSAWLLLDYPQSAPEPVLTHLHASPLLPVHTFPLLSLPYVRVEMKCHTQILTRRSSSLMIHSFEDSTAARETTRYENLYCRLYHHLHEAWRGGRKQDDSVVGTL